MTAQFGDVQGPFWSVVGYDDVICSRPNSGEIIPAYPGIARLCAVIRAGVRDNAAVQLPTPSVTVVIATRSRPGLLRKAVASVRDQDYAGRVEVVAVFDRADPEADLASDSPRRPVRVLRNERTPGLPGARNTGICASDSTLIAFCDDDWWQPSKLQAQLGAMHRLGLRAAVTGIAVQYGTARRVRVEERERLTFPDLVRDRVTTAHPSSYLADRALVVGQVGLVDEDIPGGYGEDYEWLLRVARHTDIAIVREPLVEVLWHPGSFFTRRWDTIVDALQYLLDKHPELSQDPRGLARIEGQQAFALGRWDGAPSRGRSYARRCATTRWRSGPSSPCPCSAAW